MRTLKSSMLLCALVGSVISSCSPNTPIVSPTNIHIAHPTTLPTATTISRSELTSTSTITPTNTTIPTISKTRINLSPELYLDENSSPDNLRGEPYRGPYYFMNRSGMGFVYHFGNEEWVAARTETQIFPIFANTPQPDGSLLPNFADVPQYSEKSLRQSYVQVWQDGKMLYSYPVNGICCDPKQLLRYEDHWIFWFMDDVSRHGWIVQDGILLNDLYDYESAFSLFLLDGKPLFFFQRGDQLGISFNNQEILLPYPHISYDLVCCDGGGRGARNPRGTDRMVGFWVWWGDKEYQYNEYRYIEIGLR